MTLDILTDPDLSDVRHGFLSRTGGVSSGLFRGLNTGPSSTDKADAVAHNRHRVAEAFDTAPQDLVTLKQVHSDRAVVVSEPFMDSPPEADALVTATPGLLLGVLTADCAPVLLSDGAVIAAAHAGWRGAISGVLENTIEAMCGLGAERARISAVVGPCISQRNYEVGPEFFETFFDENPDYANFFVNGTDERYLFNLPAFVLHQLRGAGVGSASWVGRCTYEDEARYFSYRRSTHRAEPDYGRQISVIRL